jgi:hypothetical protein
MRALFTRLSPAAIAIAGLGALASAALADVVVLEPVGDNTLFFSDAGALSSGSGPAIFVGNNSSSKTRRGLLRFDVAGAIPADAAITGVELRLVVSNAPDDVPRSVALHRALAEWGEGESSSSGGGGATAEPGDATWLHRFHPDVFWSTAGGDFEPAPSAIAEIVDVGIYTWSGPDLMADVVGWLEAPEANFGWLLRGEEDAPATARRIDSRESDPSTRPHLTIQFTPGDTPVETTTWSGVKWDYVGETHAR